MVLRCVQGEGWEKHGFPGTVRIPVYRTLRAGSWFQAKRKAMRAFGEVSPQAVIVAPCGEKIVANSEPEALPMREVS